MRKISAAVLVFVASLAASTMVVRDRVEINGDGRLAYAYALVDQGTATVDAYAREEPALKEDLAEVHGHFYMAKPPLVSFAVVPVYKALRLFLPLADIHSWYWRWLLTALVSGVALALLAVSIRALVDGMGFDHPSLTAVGIVIGTPLVLYATTLFGHVLAAFLLLALLLVVLRAPDHGFVAGLVAGLLASTEYVPAVGGAVLLAYHVVSAARQRRLGEIARAAVGLAIGVTPHVAYLLAVYGSPNMYAYLDSTTYRASYAGIVLPRPGFIVSVLFSSEWGLFVFVPLTIVGIAAAIYMRDRSGPVRRAIVLSLLASLATLLALAAAPDPYDGGQYGPRYLMPLVPLLTWPIAVVPARWRLWLVTITTLPQIVTLSVADPLWRDIGFQPIYLLLAYLNGSLAPSVVSELLDRSGASHALAQMAGAAVILVWMLVLPAAALWWDDRGRSRSWGRSVPHGRGGTSAVAPVHGA